MLIRRMAIHPNLRLACACLFVSTVLLMLARVVPLPRVTGLVDVPLIGLPVPVVGRVAIYTVTLVILFISYAYAVYCVRMSASAKLSRTVVAFTALLSLGALVNRDLFSNDVYGYIFYGRMVSAYGLNPYVTMPTNAPNDPALSYVDWRNLLSPYGPLWTTWSAFLDRAIPGGVAAHVAVFKIVAALTHILNTMLIGAIVRKASPHNAGLAMAAYGWNPLTVTEFAGNAHNDSLMLFWVLCALLAYYCRRPLIGAVLLGLAIATKFTAALFVPLYLVALLRGAGDLRQKARRAAVLGSVTAAVWASAWIPYIHEGGWRRMLALPEQSAWYLNSLPAAAYTGLRNLLVWLWGIAPVRAGDLAHELVTVLGIALVLVVGWKLSSRSRMRSDLIEMWFWFMFAYLFFAGPYFWPWYATSLVSLAAMSRSRYVWLVTTMLSLSAMLVYSCSDCRTYLNPSDSPLMGLAIFAVPLATLAALTLRDSSERLVLESLPRYG